MNYKDEIDKLRSSNDQLLGVTSGTQTVDGEICWVRDARKAKPLDEQTHLLSGPEIAGNNALMRCFSQAEAIDYAIKQKNGSTPLSTYASNLKLKIITIMGDDDLKTQIDRIKNAEKKFNTDSLKALYEAQLTTGCNTDKEGAALLAHYRNLSSTLHPARPLITVSIMGDGILCREIQYPVTKKTNTQKETLNELNEVDAYPDKLNSQNWQNQATQEANKLFYDKLIADDTALPAQTRKTHLVGCKNAYIEKIEVVKVETINDDDNDLFADKAKAENTAYYFRTAAVAYLGKGVSDEDVKNNAIENFEQIRMAAEERHFFEDGKSLPLHFTTLNSDIAWEKEDYLIKQLLDVEEHTDDFHLSYVPVNDVGTAMHSVEKSQYVTIPIDELLLPDAIIGQKGDRLAQGGQIAVAAARDHLSGFGCFSNQDRGGEMAHLVTAMTIEKIMERNGWTSTGDVQISLGKAGNAPDIASDRLPGSSGLKDVSNPVNLHGKQVVDLDVIAAYNRPSADTNKKRKIIQGELDLTKPPEADMKYLDILLNEKKLEVPHALKESILATKKSINAGIALLEASNDPITFNKKAEKICARGRLDFLKDVVLVIRAGVDVAKDNVKHAFVKGHQSKTMEEAKQSLSTRYMKAELKKIIEAQSLKDELLVSKEAENKPLGPGQT
ncbi:MAG: hypothetical protein Q8R24_07035 [Legionellaceae bacterium]|nr:hypothetical protein [Legionellaceae bacterium]